MYNENDLNMKMNNNCNAKMKFIDGKQRVEKC